MSGKHTPGPWRRPAFQTIRGGEDNCLIARLHYSEGRKIGEVAANARLIAAAPEMLEALKLAEEVYQKGLFDAGSDLLSRANEARQAAIAKAEGEP